MANELLTNKEAAEYLRVSTFTLDSWRCRGSNEPPWTRCNRRIIYRKADLDAFLAGNVGKRIPRNTSTVSHQST